MPTGPIRYLLPLTPYVVGGHIAFLVLVLCAVGGVFGPFIDWRFGAEWRAAIPSWASFRGYDTVIGLAGVACLAGIAYLGCLGAALASWTIQECRARRYVQARR